MVYIITTTLATFLIGSLLHFGHLFKHNPQRLSVLDLIASINESTWEHMKIFIFGVFFWSAIVHLVNLFDLSSYMFIGAIFSLATVILMPIIYYGYMHFLKKNYLAVDIGLFFFICLIYAISTWYYYSVYENFGSEIYTLIGVVIWLGIFIMSYLFTYKPPKWEIFRCPSTKSYGHKHQK